MMTLILSPYKLVVNGQILVTLMCCHDNLKRHKSLVIIKIASPFSLFYNKSRVIILFLAQ